MTTAVVFPTSPTTGQSYYINGVRFTWDGVAWSRAAGPTYLGARQRDTFTATAGQTVFTCSFILSNFEAYLNGLLLAPTDYTYSTNTLTLNAGLVANDNLEVIEYGSFDVLRDIYSESSTAPTNPVIGYLWFNTATDQLSVYGSSGWVVISTSPISANTSSALTPYSVPGVSSGTATVDFSAGAAFDITLSQNITTLDFINVPSTAGYYFEATGRVTQDATGGWTFAFPTGATNTANVTLTTTANTYSLIKYATFDNGTSWIVSLVTTGAS